MLALCDLDASILGFTYAEAPLSMVFADASPSIMYVV